MIILLCVQQHGQYARVEWSLYVTARSSIVRSYEGVQQSVAYGKQNGAGKQNGESHGMGNWIGIILVFGQRGWLNIGCITSIADLCIQMGEIHMLVNRMLHYTVF